MIKFLQSFFGRILFYKDVPTSAFFSFKPIYLNWKKGEHHEKTANPESSMEKSLINYDQVLALCNQNMDLAKKLLTAFLDELAPVAKLFQPLPSDDQMEEISKLTHKIKPSLQLLQLEFLNQKMNLYKVKYREGTDIARAELPALYNEIMSIYQIVVDDVQSYINNKMG